MSDVKSRQSGLPAKLVFICNLCDDAGLQHTSTFLRTLTSGAKVPFLRAAKHGPVGYFSVHRGPLCLCRGRVGEGGYIAESC